MSKETAMHFIFWGSLVVTGIWFLRMFLNKSTIGTRYRTENDCSVCREDRDSELRKIRVLLHQVAYRTGVDPALIEEIIK